MIKKRSLLIVDDDLEQLEAYRDFLCGEYDVAITQSPDDAIRLGTSYDYDAIILDIHMPIKDGFHVFGAIKRKNKKSTLIFITGYKDYNYIDAHEVGIDDILDKPVDPEALKAVLSNRIRQKVQEKTLSLGSLTLDRELNYCTLNGQLIELTAKETQLLGKLLERPDTYIPRNELLNSIWGGTNVKPKTLDAHLSNLRSKLGTFEFHIKAKREHGVILTTEKVDLD